MGRFGLVSWGDMKAIIILRVCRNATGRVNFRPILGHFYKKTQEAPEKNHIGVLTVLTLLVNVLVLNIWEVTDLKGSTSQTSACLRVP